MSVPENNSWDWKGFLQDEQQGCRNTSCKPQHMQQRWYLRELIWWEAICDAGVGVSDSRRQGISTPPLPQADQMCFAAKLCSFKQEIMCTLFRIFFKKKLMKTCLVLVFSFFDLSDGSKVACAIIRSGLKSMCTWKSPKGHHIASCKQRAVMSERCQCLTKVPVQAARARWVRENHSRDHPDPSPAVPRAEPRNALTASVTGPAEHGQHTPSQDRSVQVWTPSHYPLKWQDTSQFWPKWTQQYFQTMSLLSRLMGFSNSSGSYPKTSKCKEST